MVCPEAFSPDDTVETSMRAYGFAIWRPDADRGVLTHGVFASDEAALEHASRLLGTGDVLFVAVSRDDGLASEYLGQWSWTEPKPPRNAARNGPEAGEGRRDVRAQVRRR